MNEIKLYHTEVFKAVWNNDKRIMCCRGGARSSKTWSILQAIAYWLITGYWGKNDFRKGKFSVVRETLPSLRATALKDFVEILHQLDMYKQIDYRKTLLEFHYQGREVNFFSSDDVNSAKLRGRQQMATFINEANTISFEAFNQLEMRTEQFLILDLNPASMESWVKKFIEEEQFKAGIVNLHVSTFRMNPFLPQPMIDSIERLKETDNDLYQVYNLGRWVKSRNLVFEKIYLIKEMPVDYDKEWHGIDFGWHDPTALIRVLKKDNNLYIEQIIFGSKVDTGIIADTIHNKNIRKVYADNELRTIRELKSRGVRIKPAKKGKDSIRQGLGYIRQHKIHVMESSLDVIKEFRNYKYELDSDNNPTDKPLDLNNHSIDAIRYALSFALRRTITVH